jgi:hypothetical protein
VIEPNLDSSIVGKVDSIVNRAIFDKTNGEAAWYDWKPLLRKGFRIQYSPAKENILRIKGIITMKPTQNWYAIAAPAMYCKHPVLNKKAGQGNSSFKYLINPINSWNFSGPISITLKYPRYWNIEPNFISDEELHDQIHSQQQAGYSDDLITIHKTISDTSLSVLAVNIRKKWQPFFPGGPEVGIGGQKDSGFRMRYSWNFGTEIGWVNMLYSLPVETNYHSETSFCPTMMAGTSWIMLFCPSLSAGLGAVIPFSQNPKTWLRIRGDMNWGVVGVSANLDNRGSEWRMTIYGIISF